ncbi:MAG TPA: dTMP kinase [Candidatus Saccharimonadales bacterium]
MPRGKYVVIEGNDGTGKSTQVELLAAHLNEQGIATFVMHEPAGTPISDAIREVILNGDLERGAATNVLLFTACRHENWNQARTQLEAGKWVISARNYISTEVYQGVGEGFNIDTIHSLTRQFTDDLYMQPDYTFVLHLTEEEREKRIAARGELKNKDTFESRGREFQSILDNGYIAIAEKYGFQPIDAARSIDDIQAEIRQLVNL